MDEITFEPAIEHSLSESSIGSSLGDFAVPIPDEARTKGVGSTMDKLMSLIEKVDEELYENMVYKTNKKSKRLEPLFFAFRWVSVMFTQEFNLPDIIRIWDSVFSQVYGEPCLSHMQSFLSKLMDSDSSSVLDFLVQFSCAMLLCVKQEIISNDFGENMHLLQNYPVDIETIFKQLRGMRQKPKRRSISSVFEKLKRTSVKYRISNPFDSTVEVSESVLEKRDSLPKLPQLQTIKKTYELGSQDEVIELN
jgi:hypothetical protein